MNAGLNSAYSPLEALLLFQYLSNYGVTAAVFTKISDLLKNDEQIRTANTFDPGRLSPDALNDFFLRLLKQEARSEVQASAGGDFEGQNGELQPGARKRKAPSPSLPTIQEAMQNAHLIPQLIRKLYSRYREQAIAGIRKEEQLYERLKRELAEIESGALEEKLQQEIDREEVDQIKPVEEEKAETPGSPPAPVDGPVVETPKPPPEEPDKVEESAQSTPPNPSEPPPTTSPQSPAPAPAPAPSPAPPQLSPQPLAAISPRPPPAPAQTPAHAHAPQSPGVHQSPYAQQSPPPPVPVAVQRAQDVQTQNRPPASPSMLPPPVPMSPYPNNQPIPPYPYSNPPQQPPRLPMHSPYAPPQAPPPHAAPPAGPHPQYAAPQSPYAAPPPPVYPPQRGGVMLQPFAVAPQTPTGVRPPPGVAHSVGSPAAGPPIPALGPIPKPVGISPATQSQTASFSPFDVARLLATPAAIRLQASPAPSPSKDTLWKAVPAKAARARKSSPVRPQSRSVSPVSDRAPSPNRRQPRRSKQAAATSAPSVPESSARSSRSQARRGRGGSTTSSVLGSSVRGRTRSQSVVSHVEEVSMLDNESISGRRVKPEPSTPADTSDLVRPTIESTPGSSAPMAGARRAAMHSNANKRKRGARDTSETSDMLLQPRQDKSIVLAVRNFPRLSATVMNDILSHKHASLFTNPVREQDAEGYKDMIRRPQDLKSIKAAIAAGARAVNAATTSDSFSSSVSSNNPRNAGGSVWVPVSEDLVPPKGIVNSAQLEKEVMRMFANAVMFNPGEEDVVQDAREMFESAERIIADFRSVERSSGAIAPIAEGSGPRQSEAEAEEDDATAAGKRRRIG